MSAPVFPPMPDPALPSPQPPARPPRPFWRDLLGAALIGLASGSAIVAGLWALERLPAPRPVAAVAVTADTAAVADTVGQDRRDPVAAAHADSLARVAAAAAPAVAPLRLEANLAAYEVRAIAGDSVLATYRVAIGEPRYRTPRGTFLMKTIIWNPWWHPPPSDWATKDTVTPPGPSNPMGRVKLNIHELLYFHGSPARGSIGSAASHGCLRMRNEDAQALAALVQRRAGPVPDSLTLDSLLSQPRRTRRVMLAVPVPVALRYDPIVRQGDTLVFYRDVYEVLTPPRRRALLDSLLADVPAAQATEAVDSLPGVARALAWAARKRTRLAVADVGRAAALPPVPRPRRVPRPAAVDTAGTAPDAVIVPPVPPVMDTLVVPPVDTPVDTPVATPADTTRRVRVPPEPVAPSDTAATPVPPR